MQNKDVNKINSKLEDKIINAAYGNANFFDRLYVVWKEFRNSNLKKLFTDYRNTALAVHKLHQADVPDRVTDSVIVKTISKEKNSNVIRLISVTAYKFFESKLIPAAVVILVITIVLSIFIFNEPVHQNKYSNAQIELAEKQFEQALAIVGKAFTKAEYSFSNDVLDKQINQKLNKGYYLINNILIGG